MINAEKKERLEHKHLIVVRACKATRAVKRIAKSYGANSLLGAFIVISFFLLAYKARPVVALFGDSANVDTNTFSTSAVFTGVRQIQRGTVVSSATGLVTGTLASPIVNTSQTIFFFSARHNAQDATDQLVRGRLLNATTVQFGRLTTNTDPITIEWTVVEYLSGVNVQRGETMQTAALVNEVLVTPVTDQAQSFVLFSKTPAALDSGWDQDDPVIAELTTTSNLQFRSDTANAGHRIWWQVVEFTNPGDAFVQRGNTALTGGSNIIDVALGTAVVPAQSFLLVSFTSDGSGANIGSRLLTGEIRDANTLRFQRSLIGDNITEIHWELIEMNDGTAVRSGNTTFNPSDDVLTEAIAAVDVSRSVPLSTVQGAGQSMARTTNNTDTQLGESAFTFVLSSSTALEIEREAGATGELSDVQWQVIEFAAP